MTLNEMKTVVRKHYLRPSTELCGEAIPVTSLLIKSFIVDPGTEVDDEAAKDNNGFFEFWDSEEFLSLDDPWGENDPSE